MLGPNDASRLTSRIDREVKAQVEKLNAGTASFEDAVQAIANQIGYFHPNPATNSELSRARTLLEEAGITPNPITPNPRP